MNQGTGASVGWLPVLAESPRDPDGEPLGLNNIQNNTFILEACGLAPQLPFLVLDVGNWTVLFHLYSH